jgi:large subunit ribosomal protein L25
MIKDLARHPVTDRLIHVDFLRVDMAEVIETTVPLNFVGTAKGVKLGGALQIVRYEIPVSCLPKDLPGQIDLSVDDLDMDDSLRVEDVVFPEGVKPLMDPQRVLAVIHAQEAEEEEEVEEEIEVAEEEESEEE